MKTVTALWLIVVVIGLSAPTARAEVVVYPAPAGEVLSPDYEVWADGKKVDVYAARVLDPPFADKKWDYGGPYSFANFDMAGRIPVRITAKKSLRNTMIRPQSAGVKPTLNGDDEITLTLNRPAKLSIEPDGKKGPLLLFANPIEADAPKLADANVLYFGPGIHKPGRINVAGGQTLYLAGGAVVKGGVAAKGDNIRICGRGILDGSDYEWRTAPAGNTVSIRGNNVELSGITIRGSSHWTIVPHNSQHVTIRNVKICNGRVQNDDGINPCNSQDVLIADCFIRSDDDCVALKGLDARTPNNNVERITVENCVLWCDRARIFLLGHESRAPFMRNVRLRNLDIIHFTMTPFLLEPGEEMRMEDILIENVRINGEGQQELIRLRPTVNQYMRAKTPGFISDVTFRNVEVSGKPGAYRVQLEGADAQHNVRQVTFENVSILGSLLTSRSPVLNSGENVEGVRFLDPNEGRSPPARQEPGP